MMLHLTALLLASVLPSAAELKAGAAEADITPPPGYRMSGYFRERLNTGTHDPLHAKALYLEQGEVMAALVFCDLIGVPAEVVAQARQIIEQQTRVPGDHVLVAATHSHTGPLYYDVLREHFHRLAVEKHGSDPQEPFDYAERLAQNIAAAVKQARDAARPAQLAAAVAQQTGLSFNRRFHMKNGSVVFNPGRQNPNIVRPAGPIDPDLGLLLARDAANNQALALLTVFALHLDTVGGTEYSADYPFYLERALRERLGKSLVALFGAGTCGDINHIDVSTQRAPGDLSEAERIGSHLAETVLANIDRLTPIGNADLAVRTQTVDVPLQHYSPEQVEAAQRNMAKVGGKELSFLDQVEACKIVSLELRGKSSLPLEVQVFRFSPEVALVALPGEVFVELGLEVKRRSPFGTTLVVELANDNPHYVPTRKAFAEGSYEVVNSLVETGGGERLVEAAVKLLNSLAPTGAAKERPAK